MRRIALLTLAMLAAGCAGPSILSGITGPAANAACWRCNASFHVPYDLADKPVTCGSCYATYDRGRDTIPVYRYLQGDDIDALPLPSERTGGAMLPVLGKMQRPPPPPKAKSPDDRTARQGREARFPWRSRPCTPASR